MEELEQKITSIAFVLSSFTLEKCINFFRADWNENLYVSLNLFGKNGPQLNTGWVNTILDSKWMPT